MAAGADALVKWYGLASSQELLQFSFITWHWTIFVNFKNGEGEDTGYAKRLKVKKKINIISKMVYFVYICMNPNFTK